MINYDIENKFTIYEIMSGHIETEMTDCLEQMARLQVKMEHLQEEKNKQAAEEVAKQNTTEPNLRIMSEWLDKYGEILEENERERIIEEQYNKYKDGKTICNEEIIIEKYNAYLQKMRNNRNMGIKVKGHPTTYFMKQYIEATHNLFVIQQKKIDELEQKIEGILQQTKH